MHHEKRIAELEAKLARAEAERNTLIASTSGLLTQVRANLTIKEEEVAAAEKRARESEEQARRAVAGQRAEMITEALDVSETLAARMAAQLHQLDERAFSAWLAGAKGDLDSMKPVEQE